MTEGETLQLLRKLVARYTSQGRDPDVAIAQALDDLHISGWDSEREQFGEMLRLAE